VTHEFFAGVNALPGNTPASSGRGSIAPFYDCHQLSEQKKRHDFSLPLLLVMSDELTFPFE
jgi:hypothetical protein